MKQFQISTISSDMSKWKLDNLYNSNDHCMNFKSTFTFNDLL